MTSSLPSGRVALQGLYRSEGPVPWPRLDG
jgi:hypothetical protein